jgi:omega-6 fatty acid desaturase (delta-12 desaturase)
MFATFRRAPEMTNVICKNDDYDFRDSRSLLYNENEKFAMREPPRGFVPGGMPVSTLRHAELKKQVAVYERTDTKKSLRQVFNTLVPLGLFWYAAYAGLDVSYWLALPFIVLTSGFLIRTFILFHDCCHQSFFKNRTANDVLGTITGVLTHVPYRQWRRDHAIHHANSGHLDRRGTGDIWILTVEEYARSPLWRRLAYRIYRNPFVMFVLGPIAVFLIASRFNHKDASRKERVNTWLTNLLIFAMYAALYFAVGWQAMLMVQLPIVILSGMFGIWLFYVQHQFEDSYFEHAEDWNFVQAAVEGSSYYKLPRPLQWITGNIGFHHVHHLNPRVPNYHLEHAHDAAPALQSATTITLGSSLKSLRFRLWDESRKTFVTFREARPAIRRLRQSAAKRRQRSMV